MQEEKHKLSVLKLVIMLVVLIYCAILIFDSSRIIYYQFKLNNAQVDIESKYDGRYDEVKIKKEISDKFMTNTDFVEHQENSFVEYKYTYQVKLITPPFNFIFKDGFKLKGVITINK